ncbi:hypothetical protein FRC14_002046 [Serendipita sp. 396]|nr:hypothetical protein FRC14_002046 [Serendipita sp. 396]KAG8788760.1 hypothetical protein FRC15_002143 [Serendipita sp. 397]KAG8875998.1 hypothetical protein FRC20_002562 [Serendipita sp. 405]
MNFQTGSPAGEADEEIFLSGLDTHVAAKRLALAMTVWIFYDLLITTSDNAAYYLPQRWTPGRILFLLNRVFVPFIVLLDTICVLYQEVLVKLSLKKLLSSYACATTDLGKLYLILIRILLSST